MYAIRSYYGSHDTDKVTGDRSEEECKHDHDRRRHEGNEEGRVEQVERDKEGCDGDAEDTGERPRERNVLLRALDIDDMSRRRFP